MSGPQDFEAYDERILGSGDFVEEDLCRYLPNGLPLTCAAMFAASVSKGALAYHTGLLSRISESMVRLYQGFCRYAETLAKISDHFHTERAFAVKHL